MQMYGSEIATALQNNLKVTFIVLNDSRYNMVHHGMTQLFGEASEYDLGKVSFAQWADAMDVSSVKVTSIQELKTVMTRLKKLKNKRCKPAVIDVIIDPGVRIRGGGRVEALQQMSLSSNEAEKVLV